MQANHSRNWTSTSDNNDYDIPNATIDWSNGEIDLLEVGADVDNCLLMRINNHARA